jgi:restriction endonuclease S subunit
MRPARVVNQSKALDIPLALPPYEEQLRIVARADTFLRLCDELEAVLTSRDALRQRFLDTVIQRVLGSESSESPTSSHHTVQSTMSNS